MFTKIDAFWFFHVDSCCHILLQQLLLWGGTVADHTSRGLDSKCSGAHLTTTWGVVIEGFHYYYFFDHFRQPSTGWLSDAPIITDNTWYFRQSPGWLYSRYDIIAGNAWCFRGASGGLGSRYVFNIWEGEFSQGGRFTRMWRLNWNYSKQEKRILLIIVLSFYSCVKLFNIVKMD